MRMAAVAGRTQTMMMRRVAEAAQMKARTKSSERRHCLDQKFMTRMMQPKTLSPTMMATMGQIKATRMTTTTTTMTKKKVKTRMGRKEMNTKNKKSCMLPTRNKVALSSSHWHHDDACFWNDHFLIYYKLLRSFHAAFNVRLKPRLSSFFLRSPFSFLSA